MFPWWWLAVLLFQEVTAGPNRFQKSPVKEEVLNDVPRAEDSAERSPQIAIVLSDDYYDENSIEDIVKAIKKHQDEDYHSAKDVKHVSPDQKRSDEEENHEVDEALKEVFSPGESSIDDVPLETKNLLIKRRKLTHSLPYKIFIIKHALERRRKLRKWFPHSHLFLRPPLSILGSKRPHAGPENQGSSEEMLGQILRSNGKDFDPENIDIPLNNAFLTKYTTYNITKLQEHDQKNSFLFVKTDNISTHFSHLDSNGRNTNYSDSHSSSLQTVLGREKNGAKVPSRDLPTNTDFSDRGIKHNENDLKEGEGAEGNFDEEENNFGNNHHKHKFRNEISKGPSDVKTKLEAGRFNKDPKENGHLDSAPGEEPHTSHDFVSGQYIGRPLRDGMNVENAVNGFVVKDGPTGFIGGQYVEEPGHEALGNPDSGSQRIAPSDFVRGQFTGGKDAYISAQTKEADKNNPLTDFVGGQFVGKSLKESNEESRSSLDLGGDRVPPVFVDGQFIGSTSDRETINKGLAQSNEEVNQDGPNDFVQGLYLAGPKQNKNIDCKFVMSVLEETTTFNALSDVTSLETTISLEDTTGKANSAELGKKLYFNHKKQKKENSDSSSKYKTKDNLKKGISSKLEVHSENIKPSTEHIADSDTEKSSESDLGDTDINEPIMGDTLSLEPSTTTPKVISDKHSSIPVVSEGIDMPNRLSGDPKDEQIYTILPSLKEKVVFETSDEDTNVIVTVHSSADGDIEQPFIVGDSEHTFENTDSRESSESSTPNEEIDDSSPTKEYYDDNEEDILEIPSINERQNILEKDPETGEYTMTTVGQYLPIHTELPTTSQSSSAVSRGDDSILGESSDLQPNRLKSQTNSSIESFPNERSIGEKVGNFLQGPKENHGNISVVDEVELFAGENSTNDINSATTFHPELSELTTDEGTIKVDNSKEYLIELCFSLVNNKNVSLFDLLSGDYYIEKNGIKIPLQLKENPMKTCNSGTDKCKLFLTFKNFTRPLSPEILEDETNSRLMYKSKNGKRHISEEELRFIKTDNISKTSMEENEMEASSKTLSHTNTETSKVGSIIINALMKKSLKYDPGIVNKKMNSNFPGDASTDKLTHFNTEALDSHMLQGGNNSVEKVPRNEYGQQVTLEQLDPDTDRNMRRYQNEHFGAASKIRPARTVNVNPTAEADTEDAGQCGCKNLLLQSASQTPGFEHFVTKRQEILKNIVQSVGNWMMDNP